MSKPKVLVFSGYGLNCEEETLFAFELAGAKGEIIHINDLIDSPKKLKEFQILAFPGGFSYGDDTGSGNAYASKLKNHLWEHLEKFIQGDRLVIGICNGFQILVNLGLLPGFSKKYGKREVALVNNDNARYTVRWVDLKVENQSPWLKEIDEISLPIAHGEGKFYTTNETLAKLNKKKMVSLRYTQGKICRYQNLPTNPNGALEDIAAISDETGKILGMMPHPERAIFFTQLPDWTLQKEILKRANKKLPTEGPGLKIFRNAVNFFNKNVGPRF